MQHTILLAYKGLLTHQSFHKITIQEIADAAMIHRSTFYKHFEDQYALLSALLEQARHASQITITQIFTQPFTTLNTLGDEQFQLLLHHQFNDDQFREAFFSYLVYLCRNTDDDRQQLTRFLAVGRIKGITLWITEGHVPYDIFADTTLLDQIFATSSVDRTDNI